VDFRQILSFLYPQVLEKINSPISGEIKVIEQFGKRRLEIGGMTQSGGIVKEIWEKGLREIRRYNDITRQRYKDTRMERVLVLGLGGGDVVRILISNIKYQISNINITGVEINPEIIRFGKKYFGLGRIKNLEIVIADAVRFVNQQFSRLTIQPFDLILVDLYQGREIPAGCQGERFLQSLKGLRGLKGLIVFNRLYSKDQRGQTDKFVQKCQEIFKEVETKKAVCNLMVFCR